MPCYNFKRQVPIEVATMLRRLTVCLLCLAALSVPLCPQSDTGSANRPSKGSLEVLVTDQDGKPLQGVTVSVPGSRSKTDTRGSAQFSLLPGRYAVLIAKDGYRGKRVNAGIRPGETTTTNAELQKLPGK